MGIFRYRKDKDGRNRYQRIVEIYRNGKHIYKSKTFDTKREALDWEKKFLYEVDAWIITKESLKKRKVADAIQKYILTVLPERPKNTRNVLQHLKWWGDQIGHLQISEANPAVLSACRDRLLEEVGPKGKIRKGSTALRYIATMSAVFVCCVKDWMWITQNPIRSIRKPSAGKGRTRFFSQEEIHKIRELCNESGSPYLLSIFTVALHTGMRKGEILSLRCGDVDFKNREIRLATSKNGEPRDIPMTEEVYNLLSNLAAPKTQDISGLLFPSPFNPKKPVDIRSAWERILRLAGIQGATFHTIRHTTCSFLANLGIPSIIIARIAGHKDSRTTDIYTHGVKSYLHDAINKLGSSLFQVKI